MNILLWVLQILLALHTAIGAIWKFSNSEQTVPSLRAIPHEVWLGLIAIELLCAIGLILPAVNKSLWLLAPIAAGVIALEMILFSGLNLASSSTNRGEIIYWLVVTALCIVIVYGRLATKPMMP